LEVVGALALSGVQYLLEDVAGRHWTLLLAYRQWACK
jgi:hypothetical protein